MVVSLLAVQVVCAETNIGDNVSSENVTVDGTVWNTGVIRIGFNNGVSNNLSILNGGSVFSSTANIGDFDSVHNSVDIHGAASSWTVTNALSVGYDRGSYNRLNIYDHATITSGLGFVGGFTRGCNYNIATVSQGAVWNTGSEFTVGLAGIFNKLSVLDGGVVNSGNSFIGRDIVGSVAYGNSVVVSGAGSKWSSSGSLTFDSIVGSLVISNGAEVVANGGINLGDASNTIKVEDGGTLTVGTSYDASVTGITFSAGSTLAVQGNLTGLSEVDFDRRLEAVSIIGNLTVNGTLAPGSSPADSTIDGALVMGANGVLEMELGGLLAGTESDRLTVVDSATLDGTLEIKLINGFTVQNGDSFDLFDWQNSVSGAFSDVDTPALSGGLLWDTSELYTTGQLSVVPEPAVISLLLVAGSVLFVNRRINKTLS